MIATISTAGLQYIRVPVWATAAGVAVDPTPDTVEMAFLVDASAPESDDWKTGSWETDATTTPATYWARCLVGTGGAVTLAAGLYRVSVRVTDNPETPVVYAGLLRVI